MQDDYFVPSFGNRPRSLVGREDVISSFRRGLDSPPGSRERSILLLGQRGYGKTVLLQEFADIARAAGYVVAPPTIVSNDMTMRIIEKLIDESKDMLSNGKTKVSGGSVSALGFGIEIQLEKNPGEKKSYAWQLSQICRELNKKGKPVMILIDEVQATNEELRRFIIAYQEMIGEGRTISLVLAGLPSSVSSVLNDHVLTFLNRATKIELKQLRINTVAGYYESAFSELGIDISDDMINTAAKASSGSPYMMQLIGHYITLTAKHGRPLSQKDLDSALNKSSSDFINDICKTTLAPLSDIDIDFLTAMAKDDEVSLISDITERLGCSPTYAQNYKRRLIQAGVIEQPRRGHIKYAIPYLREYLLERTD